MQPRKAPAKKALAAKKATPKKSKSKEARWNFQEEDTKQDTKQDGECCQEVYEGYRHAKIDAAKKVAPISRHASRKAV